MGGKIPVLFRNIYILNLRLKTLKSNVQILIDYLNEQTFSPTYLNFCKNKKRKNLDFDLTSGKYILITVSFAIQEKFKKISSQGISNCAFWK